MRSGLVFDHRRASSAAFHLSMLPFSFANSALVSPPIVIDSILSSPRMLSTIY